MPDISMCATDDCPLRFRCYRHPASGTQPSERRQSWKAFYWRDQYSTGIHCDGYWPQAGNLPDVGLKEPPAPLPQKTPDMSGPGLFRRLVLCRLRLCETFKPAGDDKAVWGECTICGKRAGQVSVEALHRYAEAVFHDRAALAKASPPSPVSSEGKR